MSKFNKMKCVFYGVLFLIFVSKFSFSQEGIGTSSPNSNSVLHLVSADSSQGIIIPSVTTINRPIAVDAIKGMQIFNVTDSVFQICDGTKWISLIPSAFADHDFYKVGTTSAPSSINDNVFTNGNLGVGTNNPSYNLEVLGNAAFSNERIRINYNGPEWGVSIKGATTPWSRGYWFLNDAGTFNQGGFGAYGNINDTVKDFFIGQNSDRIAVFKVETGNVGIGTSTPNSKLEVKEVIDGDVFSSITNTSSGPLARTHLRVTSNGGSGHFTQYGTNYNVIPSWANSNVRAVDASVTGGIVDYIPTGYRMFFSPVNTAYSVQSLNNGSGSLLPYFDWGLNASASDSTITYKFKSNNATNTTTAFSIDNSASSNLLTVLDGGNVGIGTETPGNKLQVNGSGVIREGIVSVDNQAGIEMTSNNVGPVVIYTPSGTDDLRFWTGSDAVTVSNGGNVGIGTTAPQKKLHINAANDSLQFENLAGTGSILGIDANGKVFKSTGASSVLSLVDTDGDTKIQVEKTADDDHIRFDTRGVERMIIDTNGNIGIGTTNPLVKLDIDGEGLFRTHMRTPQVLMTKDPTLVASLGISNYVQTGYNGYAGDVVRYRQGGSTADATIFSLYESFDWLTMEGSGNIILGKNGTTTWTGNVGIGTATPFRKFHVVTGGSAAVFSRTAEAVPGATSPAITLGTAAAYNRFYSYGRLDFHVDPVGGANTAPHVTFDEGGNVGIGVTNPLEILHVDANNDSLQFENLAGTGSVLGIDAAGKVFKTEGSGSIYTNQTIAGNATLALSDNTTLVNASGGDVVVTLPTAIGNSGKVYRIKKIESSANNMIIAPIGGQTIDGLATKSTNVPYHGFIIMSDGANWFVIGIMS